LRKSSLRDADRRRSLSHSKKKKGRSFMEGRGLFPKPVDPGESRLRTGLGASKSPAETSKTINDW